MSKLRLPYVDFPRVPAKQLQRLKCGEIYYDNDDGICSFQLVCLLCKMKHYAFEDFSIHIRNVHNMKSESVSACAEDEPQDNCDQFLPEDESDEVVEEEDPIANADYTQQLSVCSFESESEPELQEDNDSQSELEMETPTATALEPSDFNDEDSESEVETEYVFKVGTFLKCVRVYIHVLYIFVETTTEQGV